MRREGQDARATRSAARLLPKCRLARPFDDLLKEARNRVSDLRSVELDGNVENPIARFAAGLLNDKAVKLSITSDRTTRELALVVADDVLRVCREALTNAVLHAKPTAITIALHYEAERFRLRVADDGIGMAANIRGSGFKPGHFGLQGMRERAAQHGGTLVIASGDGCGTTIELAVPAAIAYQAAPKSNGWFLQVVTWLRARTIQLTH